MTDSELLELLRMKCGKAKKGNGNWIMVQCPTCAPKDAGKMKRGVNTESLATKCFICEQPLKIQDLLGSRKFERVVRTVAEEPEHPQAKEPPFKGLIPINQLDKEHPAVKFFEKDFLFDLDRYWNDHEIGFIPAEGAIDLIFSKGVINTADSLVFPVRFHDEFIGWQLRFIPGTPHGDKMHKIRYMHLFKKGNHLYNYDLAKQHDVVVVVEGVKKCLKIPNSVATLGKGITDVQIQLLLGGWKKIIFMYDAELATQEKATELVRQIKLGGRQCININPGVFGYPSPDEMTEAIAQEIVKTEWKKAYG